LQVTVPGFPTGLTSGTATGSVTLTPTQAADLLASQWYMIIRTSTFSSGEIRTQLIPCISPVTISAHPASAGAQTGASVSFTVGAFGPGPITYSWKHNGVTLVNGGSVSGANTPTLTINPVALSDAGAYDCTVTSPCDGHRSHGAGLVVTQ